jgi:hypothetical protein
LGNNTLSKDQSEGGGGIMITVDLHPTFLEISMHFMTYKLIQLLAAAI